MNRSYADSEALRTRLIETYQKASFIEKQMLHLFSVIYEPVNRTAFLECFAHTGARDEHGKPLGVSVLRSRIERLLNAQLLIQERGQGPQCHPLLVEIVTRDAISTGTFEPLVARVQKQFPVRTSWKGGPRSFSSRGQLVREVRIGIYRGDVDYIERQFEDYHNYTYRSDEISMDEIFQQVCNNPFDADWFKALPPQLYGSGISSILAMSALYCVPAEEPFSLLQKTCAIGEGETSDFLRLLLTEQFLLRGRVDDAQHTLEQLSEGYRENGGMFWGWLSFVQGENDSAIAHYTLALKALRKTTRKRQVFFNGLSGLFFVLALLKDGSPKRLKEAEDYAHLLSRQVHHWLQPVYDRLHSVLKFLQGDLSQKEFLNPLVPSHEEETSIGTLVGALCVYWMDAGTAKKTLPNVLSFLYQAAKTSGYTWIAAETAELLLRLRPPSDTQNNASDDTQNNGKAITLDQTVDLHQDPDVASLADVVRSQEPWELCLNALTSLHKDPQPPDQAGNQRLVWFMTFYPSGCLLQPREQKLNANGTWGRGRPIALKRLSLNASELDYLTPQDLRVCAQIETYHSAGYYGKTEFKFSDRAIIALVGHPLVFWEDTPTIRVEIVKAEPELLVRKGKGDRLILEFSPPLKGNQDILLIKETPTRIKVIDIQPEHRRIADIIGKKNRLEVPSAAKERVLAAINAVSGIVTVQSDIGGGVENAEEVPADSQPHIHLLPAGQGLKVAVLCRPFADGGSYYRPGAGGAMVVAEIDGKRLQTTRDLKAEKDRANAAIAACPILSEQPEEDGEWLIEDPQACLELLVDLQAISAGHNADGTANSVAIEWPEGEKLRVSHQAGLNDFHLAIQRQNDWFSASGELKLSDDLVLDMQQLMELLNQSSSRFIPLGDGQFLALTQSFRKRLDELRAFTEKHGKGVRFHPLAAMALEDFIDEVGDVEVDRHWKAHVKRLKEMETLQPQVPSTLQTDLRDYQIEGFNWLSRLAHWGVGACLADDMGLGKTLQALALILTRAPNGATLIVAPTSVCLNWMSEAQRFAPTLNVLSLGSGNRQALLDQLQPFDIVICSYGLLQQDDVADKLASVEWQTIVLDEAQAIKNSTTKRSQAAMKLQGKFKLLTTGTPIENHLGELWNLFRFINPGLLGSSERFNERFAFPIERFQDKQASAQLRKLIQPFLLRRTKTQVLAELPSRTEIPLYVDLSQEERAMYEALRRDAIATLSNSDAPPGTKHLQVLAEIMKLRRLCCNPGLVMPDVPLDSSKLALFGEVLEELLDNHHKTLVFSQFVDHLTIIRAYLDEHAIAYQYLDGSTPAKERKRRVDAFQAGAGDVFLISLKAGGTGLNLTAADYVIHMDPWWNPAVEDQASDRAHRIGQQRPVTIYRLITKDTIEEKIVQLHQQKRDLADSLLEGTEASGKISTDDLLKLIQVG
ncbi:DEAD/DEAH box helicase [Myxacorys almedinensis]|uniref:ATP-dependent helicase n=1 Tax=Myxacorys almedinensis A TaxID=2690445 RepID=A0A8J7Z428_9CYAN|nr:DEAD/DEAH box helicase [Myxacorys almedinensis]NDJ17753.1 ATP-dependent helicase [Myxacorys almedinensis A]